MIRILMIGMHDKIGGIEKFLINYYRNINRDLIQFDFINMFDSICFEDEIKQMGGKVYNVINVKKNPIKFYKQLKKVITDNHYNIVHINMLSMANILPILAAKKALINHIIIHSHNSSTPHGMLRKLLDIINKKIAIKYATTLFACSELAGRWMFDKRNFEVINNAINIEEFTFNSEIRKKIRKELKIEDKYVIGNIGRFAEQKNHKYLVDIFKNVLEKNSNAVLLLIGEGELKNDIIEQVKKYNISKNVIFLNPVTNIQDYYQAMDVFVLTSIFEGLGIVTIESQASGLKTIVSDVLPKEVEITNLLEKISLHDSIQMWTNKILEKENDLSRKSAIIELQKQGYDIKIEAKKLQNKYIKMVEVNG